MCKLLEEKEKNGASKRSQLKKWERFFYWVKDGHKFIIKEIYEEPLEVEDKRGNGNRAIYVRLIEWLLAQDLSKKEGYTHTLTRKKWWKLLGMINDRYSNISNSELKLYNSLHTEIEIRWFYNRSNAILNEILMNALRSMCDRSLIDFEIQTIIVRSGEDTWFKADDEDLALLQKAKREVLLKFGLTRESQVFYRNKQDKFYEEVNNIIYDKYGWKRYFKQIKIVFDPDNIKKAIPELEMDIQRETFRNMIQEKKLELNERIVNRMQTDAANKYNKAIEKCLNEESSFLYPSNYFEAQSSLTYYLINLKSMTEKLPIEQLAEVDCEEIDMLFMNPMY